MDSSTLHASRTGAERVRYFSRQLITADDMRAEQEYFLEKLRRHNRFLHGVGVVCGLEVKPAPGAGEPLRVQVGCGYALGPCGDELYLHRVAYLDVAKCGGSAGVPCTPAPNPCLPAPVTPPARAPEGDVFVGIRHVECSTRPVRVMPAGCGCDESSCEYSRTRDGVELGCWPVPDGWKPPVAFSATCEDVPARLLAACPPCGDDPWVILARVTPGVGGASIANVDNMVRQWVLSAAALHAVCCGAHEVRSTTTAWTLPT